MIITRAPLRIPLGGGGTDLPSYYQDHGGWLISAAINKYVIVSLNKSVSDDFITLKHDYIEKVKNIHSIKHDLTREALKLTGITSKIEISSISEIPGGTGLGFSASFLVALLKALHMLKNENVPRRQLAEEACLIEIEALKKHVGKQDQYLAAFGGIARLEINKTGNVSVNRSKISPKTLKKMEENMLIFYTGVTRDSKEILKYQNLSLLHHSKPVTETMHKIKQIGKSIEQALEKGEIDEFGKLMHIHWLEKKKLSSSVSTNEIDRLYELGLLAGALGGKVMGAGGGGFLLFYCPKDKSRLKAAMTKEGLNELKFKFEFEGVKLISI